jgi:long-chain acyl-CoA synthetase
MNLADAFAVSVQKQPQKIALFWGEREYSYTDLWRLSAGVAQHLQQHFGVKPGDRVGLWLKNCPEFIPSLFGILHAGAVVVPINNFFKPDEVNYILNDAGIDVLITDADLGAHHRALETARPRLNLFRIEHLEKLEPGREKLTFHKRAKSDLAVIIYTSGTTGRPKGAMLSHGNLLHNVESCRIVLQTVAADRFAVLLPLFHSYMLTVGLLLPLLVGGSVVLVKSLHPVRNVLQEIMQRQATVLPAIPQFYRSMVNAPIHVPLPLRICVSGAAPLPVQVLTEFEAKFHIPLIEGYGLSETSPVVTKNPLDGTRKAGSIGLPIPHVEVSIQNDAGRELATKEIGDHEGYYYITDRKKDMLLVNGINVYPREIEEILYQYPGVKDAAVIGKPDPRKGEQPIAFVSPNDGAVLEEKAIQHFVRRKLADYKVPRKVVILPSLPRNATGKILKTTLRELPTPG